MQTLKNMLKRLGWPADQMTFRQITRELCRRWFREPAGVLADKTALGAASATGIVVALASEGNLNALRWAGNADFVEDAVLPEEKALFLRPPKPEPYFRTERRMAPRIPGKDLVCWSIPEKESGTGWLVDRSDGGIAFITEKEKPLEVGTALLARIENRSCETLDLGAATVVRIETLTPDLSLACLRLEALNPEPAP